MPRLSAALAVRKRGLRDSGAEGLWAGIVLPPAGRSRQFALKQLRSLAERNAGAARR